MKYIIDETSWNFDGLTMEGLNLRIDEILDVIVACSAITANVYNSNDLFCRQVRLQDTIYELFDPGREVHIEPEVRQRFNAAISKLRNIEDEQGWERDDDDVIVDGTNVGSAPSISHAVAVADKSFEESFACLSQEGNRPKGLVDVGHLSHVTKIYFISAPNEIRSYYRWLASGKTETISDLEKITPYAFPDLDFVENVISGVKKMSKGYHDVLPSIVQHLSVLNDHGATIFSGEWQHAPQKFGSLGIDISDENGNTRQDSKARKAREKTFCGVDYTFWWHTKLEPHTDRIHICQDRVAVGGKIIIGIMCDHLK